MFPNWAQVASNCTLDIQIGPGGSELVEDCDRVVGDTDDGHDVLEPPSPGDRPPVVGRVVAHAVGGVVGGDPDHRGMAHQDVRVEIAGSDPLSRAADAGPKLDGGALGGWVLDPVAGEPVHVAVDAADEGVVGVAPAHEAARGVELRRGVVGAEHGHDLVLGAAETTVFEDHLEGRRLTGERVLLRVPGHVEKHRAGVAARIHRALGDDRHIRVHVHPNRYTRADRLVDVDGGARKRRDRERRHRLGSIEEVADLHAGGRAGGVAHGQVLLEAPTREPLGEVPIVLGRHSQRIAAPDRGADRPDAGVVVLRPFRNDADVT